MRCVALVVNWMFGDVGGVDDRRGGKGVAKWMGGGVHGIVMVERERVALFVERIGWR